MELFGFEIKKKNNDLIGGLTKRGFNFIGTSLNSCGEVVFSLDTYYEIQNYIAEAQAYKTKIVNWVSNNGIYFENDKGEIFEDKSLETKIVNTFSDNTFKLFKEKYFTHHFCSGDIYLYPKQNLLGEITAQVVDSRTITKNLDNLGNVINYKQIIRGVSKEIPKDNLYNSIVRFNVNNPYYGDSLFAGILYDAMADKETSKRNFYFFKNSALPNVIFMLDPDITNKDEIKLAEESIKNKYQGTENSSKFMVSNGIRDAKVLDLSNKDLDLIQMREFFIKKMGILYQIDPRIIGYTQNAGADRSIASIRKEAKEALVNLSNQLEADMNRFYKQFIDKKFPYIIRLDSETFDDRLEIEENQRKDIVLGLQTINEIRLERGLEEYKQDWANKPVLQSNLLINL